MDHSTQHALDWLASDGFMPHGHCYLRIPELLRTCVIPGAVFARPYSSVPFALMYFVNKRPSLRFYLFIFARGIATRDA
ncbi:MAG TPA: hypothetical protein VFF26_01235 [Gallionella sp.]|nr:hypothetical protein [Gallionella sp.]